MSLPQKKHVVNAYILILISYNHFIVKFFAERISYHANKFLITHKKPTTPRVVGFLSAFIETVQCQFYLMAKHE